jgi:hypothetical protein
MEKLMKKRAALVAPLVLGLLLAVAAPALAAMNYGSVSNPIKAESASDDGNAWFYGTMRVRDGQALRNAYHFRDSAPGGNAAYVTTDYLFYKICTSESPKWCDTYDTDRSSETTSGDWLSEADEHGLDGVADRGRMKSRVCEKQAWAPDDCSNYVIGTFDY